MNENTKNYRTKTRYTPRKNVSVPGCWPIAIDIGYSSVKAFSPNCISSFPSFARQKDGVDLALRKPKPSDILYRAAGVVWNVGELANNSLELNDVNDSINTLYARQRYENPMFLVLTRVGLAMAMRDNDIACRQAEDRIVVQSGLPAAYKKADTKDLLSIIAGHHNFEVKFGEADWQTYDFKIETSSVSIIQQPLGAFFSTCIDNGAGMTSLGNKIRKSEAVLLDGGFGTWDGCRISGRTNRISGIETYPDKAMKEIFRRTLEEIEKTYGTEIAVHAIQPYLATGTVPVLDRKIRQRSHISFEEILSRQTANVCKEALEKMELAYNSFLDIDYIITAGGTSAACYDQIVNRYRHMEGLQIIKSNQNHNLPEIYDVVRGYYLFMVSNLRNMKK